MAERYGAIIRNSNSITRGMIRFSDTQIFFNNLLILNKLSRKISGCPEIESLPYLNTFLKFKFTLMIAMEVT